MSRSNVRRGAFAAAVAVALSTAVAGLAVGQAPLDPVAIRGTVLGADGQPAARPIIAYAPRHGEVGSTMSRADGSFEIRIRPGGAFARSVARNGGSVTLRIETASLTERMPQAVMRRWRGGRWERAEQAVTLQDTTPAAQAQAASTANLDALPRCIPLHPGDDVYYKAWTTIGRLNPNYGARGEFEYARERTDELTIEISPSFRGVAIGGGVLTGDRTRTGDVQVERGKGRYRILALVRYHREIHRYNSGPQKGQKCSKQVLITPERVYEKDLKSDTRVSDKPGLAGGDCRNRRVFPNGRWDRREPGDRYAREEGEIEATTLGAKVAGIGFDTQSGYSKNVTVRYVFDARKRDYYICGIGGIVQDGEPVPSSWTQLWAGA